MEYASRDAAVSVALYCTFDGRGVCCVFFLFWWTPIIGKNICRTHSLMAALTTRISSVAVCFLIGC